MQLPKQAVLAIWIPGQGFVRQGKFCLIDSKPSFVANMTARKWWKNYSGYAIAKRILDAFAKVKVRPQIIFKREDLNAYYITNRTKFQKKAVLVSYGRHSQYVLPIKNWKVKKGKLENEPRKLLVMGLHKWIKTAKEEEKPIIEDFSIPANIKLRLAKEFRAKYA